MDPRKRKKSISLLIALLILKVDEICSTRNRGLFSFPLSAESVSPAPAYTGFSGVAVPTARWYEENGGVVGNDDANTVNSTASDVVLACRCSAT